MKNLFLVGILIISLMACNNKNNDSSFAYSLEDVSAIDPDFTLPLDSFVTEIQVIPLETTDESLIGDVTFLRESDDYYFIYSAKNNALLKFDKNGKFCGRISQSGQGPEDYIGVKQMQVDNNNKLLYIMDYFGRKMKIFTFDGEFYQALPLPEDFSYTNFIAVPSEQSIYYASAYNSIQMDLLKYDMKSGTFEQLSKREREMNKDELFGGQTLFFSMKDKPYMYHYYNDTVFHLHFGKPTYHHLLRLGDRVISWDDLQGDAMLNPRPQHRKIQLERIESIGNKICIFYVVTRYNNISRKNFMAMYEPGVSHIYPHVNLISDKGFSITDGRLFTAGVKDESILVAMNPEEMDEDTRNTYHLKEDDNPVIIKYILK